jgi:phage gpG-like protein
MRRLPELLANEVELFVDDNFRDQGFAGTPWEPLGPWAAGKEKKAILVQSGDMWRSIKAWSTPTAFGVGSDLPRVAEHNFGVPSRRLPQRQMIGTHPQLIERLIRVTLEVLEM